MANPFVPTPYLVISTASTNAANIKATGGQVLSLILGNTSTTAAAFVKLYDKATTPDPASDTPKLSIPLAAATSAIFPTDVIISGQALGVLFANGIGIAIVGGSANNDNTNAPAGVIVNVIYK